MGALNSITCGIPAGSVKPCVTWEGAWRTAKYFPSRQGAPPPSPSLRSSVRLSGLMHPQEPILLEKPDVTPACL